MPAILLADADENHRRAVAIALRLAGVEVHEAAKGEDALAEVRSRRFDAVVVDLMLPGDPEGLLAASGGCRAIVTAPYPELERRLALLRRPVAFIAKPFAVATLLVLLGV